jgi:branched-chain amino acid transport system substrate-binding protein
MLATACNSDTGGSEDPTSEPETTEETSSPEMTEEETASESETDDLSFEATGVGDGTLTIGTVLPESGPLAFLGAPQIQGVQLAIDDINEAGGVLGNDVELIAGDSATDPAIARQTISTALSQGADAIVGAASSGISQEIIQTLFDNEIVQCSASNTSPSFSDQENNGFYFRTVPPDAAVAPIIANEVVNDGGTNVAVVARADDYGNALLDLVDTQLQDLGASTTTVTYNPDTTAFDAEVNEITAANPDAVVIIGFGEAATLIAQLKEAGIDPGVMYGADGLFGPSLNDDVGTSIDGFKVIGAAGGEDFNSRLNERLADIDEQGNLIYGGQAYDCAIVIALAAQAAESDDPSVFIDQVPAVTTDGTECSSFQECKDLLDEGEDIDYTGASGPLDLEGTDPTFGRYAIGEFQDGELNIVGSEDVDLSDVS